MLDNQNIQIPASRVPVTSATDELMERPWYRFFSNFYYYFINLPFGAFYCKTNQSALANTPTAIVFDSHNTLRNTSIGTPASRIVFSADGITTVTFSLQFTNTDATEDDVYVWLRKNGVDVPDTASSTSVPKKHGSTNGAAIMTVNFHENYSAGDYLEVYWLTVTGTSSITTIPATISPAKPASPGAVLTVSQII